MTETQRPLKVFLSYSSQDRPAVQELSRRLAGEGWIDTWLDVKKLLPGQDWRVSIEEAVEDSDIVIICLSNHSVTKEGYVQKELRYAREIALEKPEETIFLIPLRLDECEVPRGLRFYQWVDYFGKNKDTSYGALVESLKLRHEQKLKLEEADRARKEKEQAALEEKARKKNEEKARPEAQALAQREKEEQEKKNDKEYKRRVQKIEWQYRWETFFNEIQYRLKLLRINFVPILILFVGLVVIIPISIDLYHKFPELAQTINNLPTNTVTSILPSQTPKPNLLPTKLSTPTPTRTHLPTWTPSFTPTITMTPTPIPTEILLLQEDFEDNESSGWYSWGWDNKSVKTNWTIEQEPNGNHYASASELNDYPNILYKYGSVSWANYAFESRIKFVLGTNLNLFIHSYNTTASHYVVYVFDSGSINFAVNTPSTGYKDLGTIPSKPFILNKWYLVRLEVKGDLLSFYVDNSLVGSKQIPSSAVIRQSGVGYQVAGEKIYIDDIRVWSLK